VKSWRSASCVTRWECNPYRIWVEPPRPRKLKPKGTGRPPSASHYGKQRPSRSRSRAASPRLEESSLAGRQQRLAGVSLLGGPGAAFHGFHEGRELGKAIWLLIEWPEKTAEPTRYFFCDLPARVQSSTIGATRQSTLEDRQDLSATQRGLGLDHYEGRSWSVGTHVTLVMLAHSFLTLETLRNKKNFWWTLPRTRREIQRIAVHLDRIVLLLRPACPGTVVSST